MISRKRASIKNATAALLTQAIMMIGQFGVQTVFVRTLGATYLGANGLFGNLIQFLSFAELGIGAAFSYALYRPLAEEDESTITAIMHLFKRVYNTIGSIILVGGLILSLFVPWFIHDSSSVPHVRFYFILYLLSTVVSYFFTYNRSLLIADQRSYVNSVNQLIFSALRYIGQIIALLFFHSYFGYLLLFILGNLFSNIAITYQSHKRYPYLKQKTSTAVDPTIIQGIKHNVIGTVSSKIGSIVVNGTDNILISKFIGLSIVGLYSNYALVLNSISTLIAQVFSAAIASFGNLGVTEKDNTAKQITLFNQFTYINAFVVFFIGLVSFAFFPPFIQLWLGDTYQLSKTTLTIIIINFVFAQFRPALNMINAYGLFWGYRIKSIVEAVVNFGLSLILVKYTSLGINGVLIGTVIGNILVNSWWDPWILFSGAFHTTIWSFYRKYWSYLAIFAILLGGEMFALDALNLQITGLLNVLVFGLIVSAIVFAILLLTFSTSKSQKASIRLIREVLHR